MKTVTSMSSRELYGSPKYKSRGGRKAKPKRRTAAAFERDRRRQREWRQRILAEGIPQITEEQRQHLELCGEDGGEPDPKYAPAIERAIAEATAIFRQRHLEGLAKGGPVAVPDEDDD